MDYVVKFADYIDEAFQTPWATPNSPDAPFVKILRRLMTQEDAQLALELTPEPMTVDEIAAKTGKEPEEFLPALEKLSFHGVIFNSIKNGEETYNLVPIAPGILEFQMNEKTLDKEMVDLLEDYFCELSESEYPNLPVGTMRVVPVQESIEAEEKRCSFEEIMTYINATDRYAVAPCLCRTMKRAQGEGCGHMLETCITLGDYADFYVRTGRGRSVSKEELIEILKKTEEDGLVHHVFSFDQGFSNYICNCCGCCCMTTRAVTQQGLGDGGGTTRTNYCAEVDKEKCAACGECVDKCIFQAVKLGKAFCEPEESGPVQEISVPKDRMSLLAAYDTEWSREKWDPNYRVGNKVAESGTSPCMTECPAHIPVQSYIKLASQGRYTEALKLIKKYTPFPAICGRICHHPCESACMRAYVDEPVAIDAIKRFIADQQLSADASYVPDIKDNPVSGGQKVAVIGSGPAGLSCAYYLAIEGYKVTVFEKQPVPGGMLTIGVPPFRLGRDVINTEIDIIRKLGVEFKTNLEIGKEVTISQLRRQGYKAFFIGVGAQIYKSLGIDEDEMLKGVIPALDFLREVTFGKTRSLGDRIAVIGGGNVAMDTARTAVRVGSKKPILLYRRGFEEMPANEEEIEECREEGVEIMTMSDPVRIIEENGRVKGIECVKTKLGESDATGRPQPEAIPGSEFILEVDTIIPAVGQRSDWSCLTFEFSCQLTEKGTMQVDPMTLQSSVPDIFAGGDAVTGPATVIQASAAGKQAATSIHRFLRGDNLKLGREGEFKFKAIDKKDLEAASYDSMPRQHPAHVDPEVRIKRFEDMSVGLTEEQVRKETERCIKCGASVVDPYKCMGCGICTVHCQFDAIKLVRVRDEEPPETPLQYIQDAMKYRTARAARIEAKKKAQK